MAAGDFDGDGNADAASGATPPVLFGDGEGGFDLVGYPQEAGPGVGGSFLSAAFGDLDGDGDDELVGSGLGRVLVKVANGRESATTYADGLSPVPTSEFWGFVLAVSDVDDDGAADVVLLSDTPNEADGTRPHEILILSHWSGASSGTIRHVALPDSCTEDEQIMGLHTPDDVDGDGRSDIGFSYWRGCGEPERMTVWLLQRDDPGA